MKACSFILVYVLIINDYNDSKVMIIPAVTYICSRICSACFKVCDGHTNMAAIGFNTLSRISVLNFRSVEVPQETLFTNLLVNFIVNF